MRKLKIREDEVAPVALPGRVLKWIVTRETVGAEQLSIAIMHCPARSVVRPMHSHRNGEEVILILAGQGEAWVDGELYAFKTGDAVFFPANSRHQVRNMGDDELVTASIFSGADARESYVVYDQDAFAAGGR